MNNNDDKAGMTGMATTRKNLWLLIAGFAVMVLGFVLMIGGGPESRDTFNWSMFNFRRLVAAPVVIACGIVVEIVAIMRRPSLKNDKEA